MPIFITHESILIWGIIDLIPLDVIEKWCGLEELYQRFEDSGFMAHRCYIDQVKSSIDSPQWEARLMQYWQELAKEALSSGGVWEYRGKHRNRKGFYKSSFLDSLEAELETNADWGDTPCTIHPHVAAYDHQKMLALKGGATPQAPKYFDPQAAVKVQEYDKIQPSSIFWDGKSKAFSAIFKELALKSGFQRGKPAGRFGEGMNKLWFQKTACDGRLFCIGYPTIGWTGLGISLPFEYWTTSPDNPSAMNYIDMYNIILGLINYVVFARILYPMALYDDTEEMGKCAKIGIQAVLMAYSILIDTLDEALI